MNEDHTAEPGIPTRIGWFFWRNWNRALCATRGHRLDGDGFCERCGLPIEWEVSSGDESTCEACGHLWSEGSHRSCHV